MMITIKNQRDETAQKQLQEEVEKRNQIEDWAEKKVLTEVQLH